MQALGDRKGIHRFGEFSAPLDEALMHVVCACGPASQQGCLAWGFLHCSTLSCAALTLQVLDLSGRPHLSCNLAIPAQRIGTFDTELVEHFFQACGCSWAPTQWCRSGNLCKMGLHTCPHWLCTWPLQLSTPAVLLLQ